jgi:bifunctional pyridoxal-dependent enzyme with beta-cystathionase and maltose regulon repressor activities
MPLLKDSIRIVTAPAAPEKRLATAIEKLRRERATLADTLASILRAVNKLSPEGTYLLQLRAAAILHELDLMLNELVRGGGGE